MDPAQRPAGAMKWLDGMIYKEVQKPNPEKVEETITTKEYNWKGITILGAGTSLVIFGIYKLGQAVLKK